MKNKIMIISYWVAPVECVASDRTNSFIQYFKAFGWDVVLIRPNYNNKFIINNAQFEFSKNDNLFDLIKLYQLSGLDIIACIKKLFGLKARVSKNFAPSDNKKTGIIKRILFSIFNIITLPDSLYLFWYLINKRKVAHIYKKEKPDVVYTSALPLSCHCFGNFLSKKFNANWVAEYRDLYVGNDSFEVDGAECFERKIQNLVLKRCKKIITVSHGLACELSKQLSYHKEISVIYNGYVTSSDLPSFNDKSPFTLYCNSALYFGTLYSRQYYAFELFLQKISQNKNLKALNVNIIGNNDFKAIKSVITNCLGQNYYDKHVCLKARVQKNKIKKYYHNADILLHFDYCNRQGIISTKVFEYFHVGKPVVLVTLNTKSELAQLVLQLGGIIIDQHYDMSNFLENCRNFCVNKELLSQFSRENQAKKLSDMLVGL